MGQRLAGKVAFVTGAARGQGRSHAVAMAREGADIIAVDICAPVSTVAYPMASSDDLADTAAAVKDAGGRVCTYEADVRDLDALRAAVDDGVRQLGRLDIVVGNAGISGPFATAEQLTVDEWRTNVDINLTGVFTTVKASVAAIRAGGRGGSIVLTSSLAGLKPYANAAHYVAAKHGVVGLMRSLAVELAPDSIRVNSVNPTQVNTPMIHNQPSYDVFRPDLEHPDVDDFEVASRGTHKLPVPWVEPADISNALLFLVSDESRYITGVALPIDAGGGLF